MILTLQKIHIFYIKTDMCVKEKDWKGLLTMLSSVCWDYVYLYSAFYFQKFPWRTHNIFFSKEKNFKEPSACSRLPSKKRNSRTPPLQLPGGHRSVLDVGSGDTTAPSSAEVPGRMAHCESLFVPGGWDFHRQGTV